MHNFIRAVCFSLLIIGLSASVSGCKAVIKDGKITYQITISDVAPSSTSATATPSESATATPTEETTAPEESGQTDEKPPPTEEPTPDVEIPDGLNLKQSAEDGLRQILKDTGFKGTIYGRADRPRNPTSDHPKGLAVDLMVYKDKALGDKLADYAREHSEELKVKYVLWQVAEHYDHVHVSFEDE